MKRQKIQMLVLLSILLVLAGLYCGIRLYQNNRPEQSASEEETAVVMGMEKGDVTALSYDYDGENISLEAENDTWYAAEDHSLKIKQSRIETMIAGMAPLKAKQTIEDVTDLEQYGLKTPGQIIRFRTADTEYVLEVGDENELLYGYYVKVSGDDRVYLVNAVDINRFHYGLEDLLEEEEEQTEETEQQSAEEQRSEEQPAEEHTAEEQQSEEQPAEEHTAEELQSEEQPAEESSVEEPSAEE